MKGFLKTPCVYDSSYRVPQRESEFHSRGRGFEVGVLLHGWRRVTYVEFHVDECTYWVSFW